jgi:hypothetical protein
MDQMQLRDLSRFIHCHTSGIRGQLLARTLDLSILADEFSFALRMIGLVVAGAGPSAGLSPLRHTR